MAGCASSAGESATATNQATAAAVWDKTFPKNDKVDVEKVTFDNRLGIKLGGDLYVPKNIDRSVRHAAIIVGHPYGGVKEQSSGLYAQQMAERGFVTLAFDASYGGESGGTPRNIASPEAFTEDFSAAVDYLGTNELVDRNRIGVIGGLRQRELLPQRRRSRSAHPRAGHRQHVRHGPGDAPRPQRHRH